MGRMPDRFAREGAGSKSEYFKDGARLDWPKPKATKQSRRDVKSTKALHVSHLFFNLLREAGRSWHDLILGNYSATGSVQSTFPRSRSAIIGLWPCHSDNRQTRAWAFVFFSRSSKRGMTIGQPDGKHTRLDMKSSLIPNHEGQLADFRNHPNMRSRLEDHEKYWRLWFSLLHACIWPWKAPTSHTQKFWSMNYCCRL